MKLTLNKAIYVADVAAILRSVIGVSSLFVLHAIS